MSTHRSDRGAVRAAIVALLDEAERMTPDTLVDRLPPAEELGGEPAWHAFEREIWALGEKIRQAFLKRPALRADRELQLRILTSATDRRAHRGRQSFVLLLGYRCCAEHAARLARELEDPCVDGQVISTLYRMKAPAFSAPIRSFATHSKAWIRREARRYLAWDTGSGTT